MSVVLSLPNIDAVPGSITGAAVRFISISELFHGLSGLNVSVFVSRTTLSNAEHWLVSFEYSEEFVERGIKNIRIN